MTDGNDFIIELYLEYGSISLHAYEHLLAVFKGQRKIFDQEAALALSLIWGIDGSHGALPRSKLFQKRLEAGFCQSLEWQPDLL